MNFIYDIVINPQDNLYEVFEWQSNDKIFHLKKTLLFKVSKELLFDVINYKCKFMCSFLERIKDKTECFNKDMIKYGCIFVSDKEAVFLKFNNMGNILKLSKLLYTEELDALDLTSESEVLDIKYKKISKFVDKFCKTRKEVIYKNKIVKLIKNCIYSNDIAKLEFLYMEIFGENKDVNYILDNILSDVEKYWDSNYKNVISCLNLFCIS